MDILARFLIYFGSAFLGIGVVIMTFLRRRMSSRATRIRKLKKHQNNSNKQNFPPFGPKQ